MLANLRNTQPRLPKKGTEAREMMPASLVLNLKKRLPSISSGSRGGGQGKGHPTVVSHEELFFTVAVPNVASFQVLNGGNGFAIQPGIGGGTSLFPWLSSLAQNFEQYRFRKFLIHYYTRVPTTTAGEIMLWVDTDVNDPAPTSTAGVMSFDDRSMGPAYCEGRRTFNVLANDLHPDGKRKYMRTTTSPNTNDAKTFDAGNVWLAEEGAAAAATWGYATIEYEVELWKPQVPLSVTSILNAFEVTTLSVSNVVDWVTTNLVAGFGGTPIQAGRDLVGVGIGNVLYIYGLSPGQTYRLHAVWNTGLGTPSTTGGIRVTSASGVTSLSGAAMFLSGFNYIMQTFQDFIARAGSAAFSFTSDWNNGSTLAGTVVTIVVSAIAANMQYPANFPRPDVLDLDLVEGYPPLREVVTLRGRRPSVQELADYVSFLSEKARVASAASAAALSLVDPRARNFLK